MANILERKAFTVNVADEAILGEAGMIDPAKLKPITFAPANGTYWSLGEMVRKAFSDLETAGVSPLEKEGYRQPTARRSFPMRRLPAIRAIHGYDLQPVGEDVEQLWNKKNYEQSHRL